MVGGPRVVGETAFFAVLFWTCLYWWFVPADMRLAVPAAHPSGLVRIVLTVVTLCYAFAALSLAERFAAALASPKRQKLYDFIRWGKGAADGLSLISFAFLFRGLFGFASPSPATTVTCFAVLSSATWFAVLARAFGAHVGRPVNEEQREAANLSGRKLLREDPRRPILYLRSFEEEPKRATTIGRLHYVLGGGRGFYVSARRDAASILRRDLKRTMFRSGRSGFDEQMIFAEFFEDLGPYVAVSRPGEGAENMDLGAAKIVMDDVNWQEGVTELIEASVAIVVDASHTPSLLWEIRQIVLRSSPRRLLLVLPRTDEQYRKVYEACVSAFPKGLPLSKPESRLLTFSDAWEPVALENPTCILEDALEPFCERLNFEAHRRKLLPTIGV